MDTLDTLRNILEEYQGIAPESVTESSTFDDLAIDSIDMVELICELEDRLDIDFGEPEGLTTVGELVDYVDDLRD